MLRTLARQFQSGFCTMLFTFLNAPLSLLNFAQISASERKYVRMQIYNSRSSRRDATMRNRFLILIPALAAVGLLFWEGGAAHGFWPHALLGVWVKNARASCPWNQHRAPAA